MRELLQPYRGPEAVYYLCILARDLLKESSLSNITYYCSAYESVLKKLPLSARVAIMNLRASGFAPTTRRSLELMLAEHARYLDTAQRRNADPNRGQDENPLRGARFHIAKDLTFTQAWTDFEPVDVCEARSALSTPLALRQQNRRPSHDAMRSAELRAAGAGGYNAHVKAIGAELTDAPPYDLSRVQHPPASIKWSDLLAQADRFDQLDIAAGRQIPGERSWHGRLIEGNGTARAVLMEVGARGLVESDSLLLEGLKHVIGLPGAGKTTLLYLLAAYLAAQDYKVCFLFPSIEVATNFIEILQRYSVSSGLMYGQSDTARPRHVMNFAASMGAQNNGFGVTRSVAPYFATNCALAGFTSDEDEAFPHSDPPCLEVQQAPKAAAKIKKHRCGLAGMCGRMYAEREALKVNVMAGHVLSIDRTVSPLYVDYRLQQFELIARTFDLLVIDECDNAQTTLDARGTPMLKLTGDRDALWATLNNDLHGRIAQGTNAFVSGKDVPSLIEMTGRFGRATERLVGRIQRFDDDFKKLTENMLLTSASVIADLFPARPDDVSDEEADEPFAPRMAFERVWDHINKRVAFRDQRVTDDEDDEEEQRLLVLDTLLTEVAAMARVSKADYTVFYEKLLACVEQWDRDGSEEAMTALIQAMRAAPGLTSPHPDVTFAFMAELLATATPVILQHFGLAPHLRLMNSAGLVSSEVFESRPSRDQMAIFPEALIGKLSGVRYTMSEARDVNVAHVAFEGTPRLLPQRMIELSRQNGNGLAVLMTSATSMLEQSPSFHVTHGPHYILKRPNAGAGWKDSRYRFLPQRDPVTQQWLRFSGGRHDQRDRSLCAMASSLLKDGELSAVESARTSNDLRAGLGRKVGFVVNSYDQCALLFKHINDNFPEWRGRVRYLVRTDRMGKQDPASVTASEVENLGSDRSWDLVIFPMNAIGRGVNIVYKFGARVDHAMIGSLFFLTRPHPRSDSLQLMQGLIGRDSERFDKASFSSAEEALNEMRRGRGEASRMIRRLLRLPLMAQRLGSLAEPFVADNMIIILQTIGRAMRGDCPAFVYFVDSAWAPRTARGETDTARTSMLVMMHHILSNCLAHPQPAKRECYANLYQTFFEPLSAMIAEMQGENA